MKVKRRDRGRFRLYKLINQEMIIGRRLTITKRSYRRDRDDKSLLFRVSREIITNIKIIDQ